MVTVEPDPWQTVAAVSEIKLETLGTGFTVTSIGTGFATQLPAVEVAVTLYTTEPATLLLGSVRV